MELRRLTFMPWGLGLAGTAVVASLLCGSPLLRGAGPSTASPLEGRLARGRAALAARDHPAAREAFAQAAADLEAAPAHRAIALLHLAETFRRAGQWAAAEKALARVALLAGVPAHLAEEARATTQENARLERGGPARDPRAHRLQRPDPPPPAVTWWVAPHGSDAAPGTAEQPFATLERARDAVRALAQAAPLPDGGAVVQVRGGRYRVTQTLQLSAGDSGRVGAPIRYRAVDGETPVFTGGLRVTGFGPVSDPAVRARLPEPVRERVVQADLKALGLTNLWPLELGGFASGRGFRTHPVMELFFNGRPLTRARWPNTGFVRVAAVTGSDRAGAGAAGDTNLVRLRYEGDRPSRWEDEPEILLYGYWYHDWADSYERVVGVDASRREFTLAAPYHTYGYRPDQRFYALNLLAEIDEPGEWYLERRTGLLYLYPPSDPAAAQVELSTWPRPFLELEQVSHVSFEGLTWELGAADALTVRGGTHVAVVGCTLRRCAGNGLELRGGTDHVVLGCDVSSMGRGGLVVAGGDRRTLEPGRHTIENCHLHDLSRVDHTYTPAVWLDGVGNRIAHNLMHHLGSSALRIEGNDHRIEYNEIAHVVQESDDQGGVDMFGNATYRGNVYRHNFFHHLGHWRTPAQAPACGQAGIRIDDAISGTLVQDNVFLRCATGKLGFGGVQIHGGKDNLVDRNLFLECATAVSFSPWGERRWRDFTQRALDTPPVSPALYVERYPDLARLAQDPDTNFLWRNVAVRCGAFLRRAPGSVRLFDNVVIEDDPALAGLSRGTFDLDAAASDLARLGFRPIPLAEIGLYRDAARPELPTRLLAALRAGADGP